jgi:AraC family ethanolamine operon transcriptional activator
MSISSIAISHQIFHDIDELESLCRADGKRGVTLTQLSLEQLQCHIIMVDFGEARLTFAKPNIPLQCVGPKAKGYMDFCCTLNPHRPKALAHGHRISHNTFLGFDNHREAQLVIPAGQIHVCLQVRRSLVEGCAEALEREELNDRYWRKNFAYAPETSPTVKNYLREFLMVTQRQPDFLQQPSCRKIILEDLLPLMIGALPSQPSSPQCSTTSTYTALVKRADAYIQDHLEEPLTVRMLMDAIHTSKRTLFYAFENSFGLGPMAYVKAQRLLAVHRRLKAGDPTVDTVTEIAQQYGFWSLGHFGRDYKAMFGEKPSDTLKKIH